MPLPIVLGLLLKKDKPTWTMEKTWAGRGAQQVPAPSPAAAACKFASLPTATRRQRKGFTEPPEVPTGAELCLGTECTHLMYGGKNQLHHFTKCPKPEFHSHSYLSRPPMIPEQ